MGVSFEVYSNGKNIMTIKSYQMNSVLFFVQFILLSQLVLSRYECSDQGYKAYLNDLTYVKKGFVGHKEDVGLPGDWIPTEEKYVEYWIGLILKVDI